jgi:hypothetical protein
MLLVPRQLLRSGMTGNAPYYGGRLTPAQAYAASHASWRPTGPAAPVPPPTAGRASGPASLPAPARSSEDSLLALQHLLETGVLTQAEYADLRSRVAE